MSEAGGHAAAVRASFRRQAASCEALGSPFTAWLCRRLADALDAGAPVGRRVLGWPRDPSAAGDALALRLCGALHALALSGRAPALAALYAAPRTDGAAWDAIAAALGRHAAAIVPFLDSPPQTNEVARSGALFPALSFVAATTGRSLDLLEIGASAGLNLNSDRYAYRFGDVDAGAAGSPVRIAPDLRGAVPPAADPGIARRRGCDVRPVDPLSEEGARRLLAYVWPDQPQRLTRLRGALDIARGAPPVVDRADAVDWLSRHLRTARSGRARVVYSTVAWQYLDAAAQATAEARLADAGDAATPAAPLAWVRLEADTAGAGAALTLDLWDGRTRRRHIPLGRADFHGRWLDWQAPAP